MARVASVLCARGSLYKTLRKPHRDFGGATQFDSAKSPGALISTPLRSRNFGRRRTIWCGARAYVFDHSTRVGVQYAGALNCGCIRLDASFARDCARPFKKTQIAFREK